MKLHKRLTHLIIYKNGPILPPEVCKQTYCLFSPTLTNQGETNMQSFKYRTNKKVSQKEMKNKGPIVLSSLTITSEQRAFFPNTDHTFTSHTTSPHFHHPHDIPSKVEDESVNSFTTLIIFSDWILEL